MVTWTRRRRWWSRRRRRRGQKRFQTVDSYAVHLQAEGACVFEKELWLMTIALGRKITLHNDRNSKEANNIITKIFTRKKSKKESNGAARFSMVATHAATLPTSICFKISASYRESKTQKKERLRSGKCCTRYFIKQMLTT